MEYFTKRDWKEIFESCGIRRGYRVLLQLDLQCLPPAAGGIQTILEALMEVVTEAGTIILPAFTTAPLDPACLRNEPCDYEGWQEYRRSLFGYQKEITAAPEAAVMLQRLPGSCRTEHPVSSFVLWGYADPEWLKQPLDFPVSFGHVFSIFEERMACNLLVGVPWEKSLLVQAMAHLLEMETVSIQKAWLHRPKRNLGKTYLTGRPNGAAADEVRDLIQTEKINTMTGQVQVLSMYSLPQKTREIWENSRRHK